MQIDDEYTAFCFDEACYYISKKLEAGEKPIFIEDRKKEMPRFRSPSEFYKTLNLTNS